MERGSRRQFKVAYIQPILITSDFLENYHIISAALILGNNSSFADLDIETGVRLAKQYSVVPVVEWK